MLITLIAAIGFGSIVAAWIARLTAISGFRQAWINALREDFAEWMKQQEIARYNYQARLVHLTDENFDKARKCAAKASKAQHTGSMLYYRIATRLNFSEPDHRVLLLALTEVGSQDNEKRSDPTLIARSIDAAAKVFKREWEVTKWGMLAGTATRAKAHWRFLFH